MENPESWRLRPAEQQPFYEDPLSLERVLNRVSQLPPLVHPWEVNGLLSHLGCAVEGQCFFLQGGDCAETFDTCQPTLIKNTLKTLYQMARILQEGMGIPVVILGRLAGQYAKPRSMPWEVQGGVELPAYRGDAINSPGFTWEDRCHNPHRLKEAWFHACATQNFIRAFLSSGEAQSHWDSWAGCPQVQKLMDSHPALKPEKLPPFFCSHEALLLEFEAAQTQWVPDLSNTYNLSTHFLWIGERTRSLNGAHVSYAQTLTNPIGVKVGPGASSSELVALCHLLNPKKIPGKLTFITRLGATQVTKTLPPLVEAVARCGTPVLWVCDPMHGNGVRTPQGYKTRSVETILQELSLTMRLLREGGGHLGGLHLELTGQDVTECVGPGGPAEEEGVGHVYTTACDPRLNSAQSLLIAQKVVEDIGRVT